MSLPSQNLHEGNVIIDNLVSLEGLLTILGLLAILGWVLLRRSKPLLSRRLLISSGLLGMVVLVRAWVFEPFSIPTGSMLPSLHIGDIIIVQKYAYRLRLPVVGTTLWTLHHPARGDVVVFDHPKLARTRYIKRVVGLPGDEVVSLDGRFYVNGSLIEEGPGQASEIDPTNPGQIHQASMGAGAYPVLRSVPQDKKLGYWKVPANSYFVLGDHRDRSEDSRYWGFLPEDLVLGKAVKVFTNKAGDADRWNQPIP